MILLRRLLGDVLRRQRQHQSRTLREVSSTARVSLGYLSEIERGQKEASSELLESICGALGLPLSSLLREVSDGLATAEMAVARREPVCARQVLSPGASLPLTDPASVVPHTVPADLPPLEPRGGDVPVGSGAVHAR
jgi:transcriptional regulator with XRE-family HTH domain